MIDCGDERAIPIFYYLLSRLTPSCVSHPSARSPSWHQSLSSVEKKIPFIKKCEPSKVRPWGKCPVGLLRRNRNFCTKVKLSNWCQEERGSEDILSRGGACYFVSPLTHLCNFCQPTRGNQHEFKVIINVRCKMYDYSINTPAPAAFTNSPFRTVITALYQRNV